MSRGLQHRRRPSLEAAGVCVLILGGWIFVATASAAGGLSPGDSGRVTFSRDIAPIVFKSCAVCHRPGGSAGFSLLSYRDIRPRAREIVEMTARRIMPPWQPEAGFGHFAGERRLTDAQIALFQEWLKQGMLEGTPSDLPSVPDWGNGWEFGEPDLIVKLPTFSVEATGPDVFRNFVIPITQDRFVKAWEFRPGNSRVVHHATMQLDPTPSSRQMDDRDPRPGYEGLIALAARFPDGFFLDWAPGHGGDTAVEGTAWPLHSGSDLVVTLHLRPDGEHETVTPSLGLYFAKEAPSRLPVMLRLAREDLDIAPGQRQFQAIDSYVLPVDVDAYTVQPHAHYLAREMKGFATLPDGKTVWLVYIKDWDFNWQDVYHYSSPVFLPAGTRVTMEYTYDNSVYNRKNPSRPPVRVTYGQQTSDEMAELWFQVVPRRPQDRQALMKSLHDKVLPEEIKGRQMMLAKDPDNVALHDDLALLYAQAGDAGGVLREFRESLRLQPESAAAHYNVGAALLAGGDRSGAEPYFEAALTIDPSHAKAHSDLAVALQMEGDLTGALDHHRQALRLAPESAEVQLNAGVGFAMAGATTDAVEHLRLALRLRPNWANAQAALASVLSSVPTATPEQRREAVNLAEHAVASTGGQNAAFVEILSSARTAMEQLPE
jgi:tetratricopeptide (TPR) repeat protein/mono/diheme cytochrome c family protein